MIPSRATLYGMAVVAAIAAHGAVVALLWSGPPASPSPPAVHVRLIERPAPVASATQTAAPTAPVAAEPGPGPGPRKKPVLDAGLGPKVQPEPKPVPEPEPGSEPQGKPPLRPEPAVRSGRSAEPAAMPQGAPGPAPAQSLPEPELALYCPHRPPPRYPATARRLGQEGVVELQVELSAAGAVTEVRVVRSSGWPTLDRAAVAAVRDWHCDAPRVDGAAVAASARQRIRFSLR